MRNNFELSLSLDALPRFIAFNTYDKLNEKQANIHNFHAEVLEVLLSGCSQYNFKTTFTIEIQLLAVDR